MKCNYCFVVLRLKGWIKMIKTFQVLLFLSCIAMLAYGGWNYDAQWKINGIIWFLVYHLLFGH